MGTWSIYTFGDLTTYWGALNAVAAYFNNTGFINGASLLGGLVGLTYILFGFSTWSTDIGRSMRMAGIWGGLVFAVFLPVNVQVTNVYTSHVIAVNNVPAIVAIPASVFTTVGWSITQSMDTAFQGTSGSYLTVGQNGLMNPLEIYLSFMNDSFAIKQQPEIFKNLTQMIADCSRGGTIVRGSVPAGQTGATLDTSIDIIGYITANMRTTGLTTWYDPTQPNSNGTPIACAAVGDKIQSLFNGMMSSSSTLNNLIAAATNTSTSVTGVSYTVNDYKNVFSSFSSGVNGLQQSGDQQGIAMLVSRTIDSTFNCLAQESQIASGQSCQYAGLLGSNTIMQMQNEMVLNGSTWEKMLYSSMDIMQYLFFSLSPITLLVILIWPMHSPKMFLGYMMFGLWIASWLMFTAPMNYYIQSQITQTIQSIQGPLSGLTIANYDQFRDLMMQKLAFASSLIAQTPLISLAILSGSYLGLNSLATGLSGEGHAKGDDISPRLLSRAAYSQGAPAAQHNMNSGLSLDTGASDMTFKANQAKGRTTSSLDQLGIKSAKSTGTSISITDKNGDTFEVSNSDVMNYGKTVQRGVDTALKASGSVVSAYLNEQNGLSAEIDAAATKSGQSREAVLGALSNKITGDVLNAAATQNPDIVAQLNSADSAVSGRAKAELTELANTMDHSVALASVTAATIAAKSAGTVAAKLPGVGGVVGSASDLADTYGGKAVQQSADSFGLNWAKRTTHDDATAHKWQKAHEVVQGLKGEDSKSWEQSRTFSVQDSTTTGNGVTVTTNLAQEAAYLSNPHNAQEKTDLARKSYSISQKERNDIEGRFGHLETGNDPELHNALVQRIYESRQMTKLPNGWNSMRNSDIPGDGGGFGLSAVGGGSQQRMPTPSIPNVKGQVNNALGGRTPMGLPNIGGEKAMTSDNDPFYMGGP